MKKTVVVVSDIAGHLTELNKKLRLFGVDLEHLKMPEDVVVVLNGDMIHRGPESYQMLETVNSMIQKYPDNFLPIVGNHEANYIPDNPNTFGWNEFVMNAETLVPQWWENGVLRPCVGVVSDRGNFLISHAGLTVPFWNTIKKPDTLGKTVEILERMVREGDQQLWNGGEMLGYSSICPGPLWASSTELYGEWTQEYLPFHQIHGHASPWEWDTEFWWLRNKKVQEQMILFHKQRQSLAIVNGQMIIGTDPSHDHIPAPTWEPLVLHNARIVRTVKH